MSTVTNDYNSSSSSNVNGLVRRGLFLTRCTWGLCSLCLATQFLRLARFNLRVRLYVSSILMYTPSYNY